MYIILRTDKNLSKIKFSASENIQKFSLYSWIFSSKIKLAFYGALEK
jgi:hypothetical protein